MNIAGHVLQPGETIEHDGLRFHVERVERRRLLRVRMELPKNDTKPPDDTVSGEVRPPH
jgi:Mg2+/Co2+ transporter CorC